MVNGSHNDAPIKFRHPNGDIVEVVNIFYEDNMPVVNQYWYGSRLPYVKCSLELFLKVMIPIDERSKSWSVEIALVYL